MAEYKVIYTADGAEERQLEFAGKVYRERYTPFENAVSHQLDSDLYDQVEADFPDQQYLLELIEGLEWGDVEKTMPLLTQYEKRAAKEDE